MTPWSVSPRAGCPSSAARAAIASILQAPSSSEYSLWAWRWTAEGVLTRESDHAKPGRCHRPAAGGLPRYLRDYSASARADPGTAARVGPDFGGDPILFGLRGGVRLALASVEVPSRGQDLVSAAGAARGVQRPVVAAGLAHDDVWRDREGAAEPAPDLFFGRGPARRFRRFDVAHPGSDPVLQGRERCSPRRCYRTQLRGGRFGLAAHGGDFRAGGRQPLVVGVGVALELGDRPQLGAHLVADLLDPPRERAVELLDLG